MACDPIKKDVNTVKETNINENAVHQNHKYNPYLVSFLYKKTEKGTRIPFQSLRKYIYMLLTLGHTPVHFNKSLYLHYGTRPAIDINIQRVLVYYPQLGSVALLTETITMLTSPFCCFTDLQCM